MAVLEAEYFSLYFTASVCSVIFEVFDGCVAKVPRLSCRNIFRLFLNVQPGRDSSQEHVIRWFATLHIAVETQEFRVPTWLHTSLGPVAKQSLQFPPSSYVRLMPTGLPAFAGHPANS